MTIIEKDIKIAEHDGWTNIGPMSFGRSEIVGSKPTEPNWPFSHLPKYHESRESVIPLIQKLSSAQKVTFSQKLQDLTGKHCLDTVPDHRRDHLTLTDLICSKPAHLAQAYGLTLGLWKEGE